MNEQDDDEDLETVFGVGGCDNDIDTIRKPTEVARRFLQMLNARWSRCHGILTDDDVNTTRQLSTEELLRISLPARGVLFIFRDRDMDAYTDDRGHLPMPDGDGMLALWFWPSDPSGRYRLDLVTPALPALNDFSNWAVERLADAARS